MRPSQPSVFEAFAVGALDLLKKILLLAIEALEFVVGACRSSRVVLAAVVLVCVMVIGGIFDAATHAGRIYDGVTIGGVDVGGMTSQEASDAVREQYSARISNSSISIYANQDAMDNHKTNAQVTDDQSVEEAKAGHVVWEFTGSDVGAQVDYDALGEQALSFGRDGIFARLGSFFTHREIPLSVALDDARVEDLALDIDETIGTPYKDYGIVLSDGVASVDAGHDGHMVNREVLKSQISTVMLTGDDVPHQFVALLVDTSSMVSDQQATRAVDMVNDVISQGVSFSSEAGSWTAQASEIGSWIDSYVAQYEDGSYYLQPYINAEKAKNDIVSHLVSGYKDGSVRVTFSGKGNAATVKVAGASSLPDAKSAVEVLNGHLFGLSVSQQAANASVENSEAGGPVTISVGVVDVPSVMSFDEALDGGVICKISEYTTEYAKGAEARNTNIHLAAELLDGSATSADSTWSFNDVAGECNEQRGFKSAGTIVGNKTVDSIGGGICQVATTVFNAVYDAGYPIVSRTNHSVYIPSYPAGRDAAVSWPDLDLVWQNDGASDVYLKMDTTETTVTASLYGIDPGYRVQTQEGTWTAGDKAQVEYVEDPTLPEGEQRTETKGQDGRSFQLTRIVSDSEGKELHADVFSSTYVAQDTVIARGVGSGQAQ